MYIYIYKMKLDNIACIKNVDINIHTCLKVMATATLVKRTMHCYT